VEACHHGFDFVGVDNGCSEALGYVELGLLGCDTVLVRRDGMLPRVDPRGGTARHAFGVGGPRG